MGTVRGGIYGLLLELMLVGTLLGFFVTRAAMHRAYDRGRVEVQQAYERGLRDGRSEATEQQIDAAYQEGFLAGAEDTVRVFKDGGPEAIKAQVAVLEGR